MARRSWLTLALAGLAAAAGVVIAQTKPASLPQQTFVILYQPGPNWIKGREIFEQDLHDHGQYMATLLQQGHLLAGGPFSDSSGGMAVIEANSADEAAAISKKDPGVINGVFKATLHPWYVAFRHAF